jgi:hypothetical protein
MTIKWITVTGISVLKSLPDLTPVRYGRATDSREFWFGYEGNVSRDDQQRFIKGDNIVDEHGNMKSRIDSLLGGFDCVHYGISVIDEHGVFVEKVDTRSEEEKELVETLLG